jgi:hypothetical protein
MCNHKRLHIEDLIEGVDFYWQEIDGIRMRVFTKEYLISIRPMCCESGCINCPWDYLKKDEL